MRSPGRGGNEATRPIHTLFGLPSDPNNRYHSRSFVGIWKSPAERSAMNKPKTFIVATLALASLSVMSGVEAQQQQPQQAAPQLPQAPNMTFFVTSVGPGKGADLGGLEGGDRHCQELAQRHGAGGKTWHADRKSTRLNSSHLGIS